MPELRLSAALRSAVAVMGLLVLTEAFYLRPQILLGTSVLVGSDYGQLHIRRIRFARNALFGARHTLPGWYPHEVLGTPFAANLQSFPWIPTRLLLLALDPLVAYAAAIAMAAALSGVFTYLYCRRTGLTRTASVTAGGTFAGAGFFASRVMAGHLPLLEAYPALPLLLWLVDRAFAPERANRHRFDLGVLAISTACVVAAGHPQLPAYALFSALLFAIWKGRHNHGYQMRAKVVGVMALGAGLTFAVWWPMLLLIARSTRVLSLGPPDNDIAMPYGRLLALLMPGIHGWAQPMELADLHPFTAYPNQAYFWDTASYVGILPLVAIVALAVRCLVRRRLPNADWTFLSCLGIAAFLCSLPFARPLLHAIPGTLLRSPARLLYISTFCAAVALGSGVDVFRRSAWPRRALIRNGLVAVVLSAHFADLWGFAHRFIEVYPRKDDTPAFQAILDHEAGDGRIAQERLYHIVANEDRHDDAGGFDSIFLAPYYRAILALAGAPPGLNRQWIDASELPLKALQATGVRFVITTKSRADLKLAATDEDNNLYRVPNPAPRADLFPAARTEFAEEQQIPDSFAADPHNRLLLSRDAEMYFPHLAVPAAQQSTIHQCRIDYLRPSSDEILLRTRSGEAGFAQVLETYDPGWTATVDASAAPVLMANGFAMAVPVPGGSHIVSLRYATPGRAMGAGLSLVCLACLVSLLAAASTRT